jgi:hypothetical protein
MYNIDLCPKSEANYRSQMAKLKRFKFSLIASVSSSSPVAGELCQLISFSEQFQYKNRLANVLRY